jgi:PTH1 family peptidyl-tRNA hydrolase
MADGHTLLVGLGNPGPRYAGNRHNVGFMVVEALAREAGISLTRAKFKGIYGNGSWEGRSLVLLEPQTFMNLSGQSVSQARSFFNVENADILVVHDELDLPFGTLRLKVGGGHAGHNGLRSIVAELGTPEFARLRVGIGRPPPGKQPVVDWVLQDFGPGERPWLPDLVERGVKALRLALKEGVAKAMNSVNTAPA